MKSTERLMQEGLTTKDKVITKLNLNKEQVRVFDLWCDWVRDSSRNEGIIIGKSQLAKFT